MQADPILEKKIRDLLEAEGLTLVELRWKERRNGPRVTAFVDLPEGGVGLELLRKTDSLLATLLDEEISDRYLLEVSSPGLDRPLETDGDFRRNLGRTIRVRVEGGSSEGVLVGFDDASIEIDPPGSERKAITRRAIVDAVVVPGFRKTQTEASN